MPTANPGIINEIVARLEWAGQRCEFLTVEEIATHLARKFPERDLNGMIITIRAQVSRLPTTRGIPVVKRRVESGKMGYSSMG